MIHKQDRSVNLLQIQITMSWALRSHEPFFLLYFQLLVMYAIASSALHPWITEPMANDPTCAQNHPEAAEPRPSWQGTTDERSTSETFTSFY